MPILTNNITLSKSINKYRSTHFTIPLNAFIIKRFHGGKKPLNKAAKAVGKAYEPYIGATSNANTPSLTESSISKYANNAAAQLQTTSPVLSTTEIIKPQSEKFIPSSTPFSQIPPKTPETLPPKNKEYESTSNNAWTSFMNSSNSQSIKDDFDPADEALKLAFNLGANSPASSSVVLNPPLGSFNSNSNI